MGKSSYRGRRKTAFFIMLRHDMLRSPAFRSLFPPARAIYLEILNRYNGMNNSDIPLSCREAAELCRISKGTATRAMKELQEAGFIRIGKAAGFNMKKRTSTRWTLTHEAIAGQYAPTNEWRNWKPKKQSTDSPEVLIGSTRGLNAPKPAPEITP